MTVTIPSIATQSTGSVASPRRLGLPDVDALEDAQPGRHAHE
jgi:hypothetical protein